MTLQGNVIQNNAKHGVIVQQYGLALREVNRSQAGNYTCIASNVEGDGYSNAVELKIMCKYPCASFLKSSFSSKYLNVQGGPESTMQPKSGILCSKITFLY